MSYRTTLLVIAALAGPIAALRAGEVYKSVDAQGHVVYSDQPDMSLPQTRVEIAEPNLFSDDEAVRTIEAPPPLPDYAQPASPADGSLWTPGYWDWSDGGYDWVQGAWVPPPQLGTLWTPAYWECLDGVYIFHRGYWAPYVGYYGGINYGFGYPGSGFTGGRWVGSSFVYNRTAGTRTLHNQVSYHGGPGGTTLAPTAQEKALAAQRHIPPTPLQRHYQVQAAALPRPVPQAPARVAPSAPGSARPAAAAAAAPRSVTTTAARSSAVPPARVVTAHPRTLTP
jgi:Domain of unknown function (DUF4124)/WXXGXW repeat (2 copies)